MPCSTTGPYSIASLARARSVGGCDAEGFLGLLFIASVRYRIKFADTAKYKTRPHAKTINTNQNAIFPSLGTCP
jgi:hypothetical protein